MTFPHNYSPAFYLRGDFTANNGKIIIDDLYKSTTVKCTPPPVVLSRIWGTLQRY